MTNPTSPMDLDFEQRRIRAIAEGLSRDDSPNIRVGAYDLNSVRDLARAFLNHPAASRVDEVERCNPQDCGSVGKMDDCPWAKPGSGEYCDHHQSLRRRAEAAEAKCDALQRRVDEGLPPKIPADLLACIKAAKFTAGSKRVVTLGNFVGVGVIKFIYEEIAEWYPGRAEAAAAKCDALQRRVAELEKHMHYVDASVKMCVICLDPDCFSLRPSTSLGDQK